MAPDNRHNIKNAVSEMAVSLLGSDVTMIHRSLADCARRPAEKAGQVRDMCERDCFSQRVGGVSHIRLHEKKLAVCATVGRGACCCLISSSIINSPVNKNGIVMLAAECLLFSIIQYPCLTGFVFTTVASRPAAAQSGHAPIDGRRAHRGPCVVLSPLDVVIVWAIV